jgi:hypothetical protein
MVLNDFSAARDSCRSSKKADGVRCQLRGLAHGHAHEPSRQRPFLEAGDLDELVAVGKPLDRLIVEEVDDEANVLEEALAVVEPLP